MFVFARVVVSLVTYAVANQLGFLSLTAFGSDPFVASIIALPIGLLGAVGTWKLPLWKRHAALQPSTIACVLRGAAIVGSIGFCGGFFGPMVFAPGANQGPLLGIFITGPLGTICGAIGGFVYDRLRTA